MVAHDDNLEEFSKVLKKKYIETEPPWGIFSKLDGVLLGEKTIAEFVSINRENEFRCSWRIKRSGERCNCC